MLSENDVVLRHDCTATAIPAGTKVLLTAGTPVRITQSLGGHYTVAWDGGLAQIAGGDSDALGLEPAETVGAPSASEGPADEALVWSQLRNCYDPEIPINIVDLGLVYDCHLAPRPEGGTRVAVKMTLTAPGCGMSEYIKADVENRLRSIPGVTEAEVELVWDPPWNQDLMTEAAKLELGLM